MQTFLPYPDFEKSASVLDMRRLGKQRLEGFRLLELMAYPERTGWRNHPAFKMWDGYDVALANYVCAICNEWISRGYKDGVLEKTLDFMTHAAPYGNQDNPEWLGDESLHSSHRAALLYKNQDFYGKYGWEETPAIPTAIHKNGSVTLPYVWPGRKEQ